MNALAVEVKRDTTENQPLIVTGHTDSIGKPAQNQRLSLARAATVKDLLVQQGIAADRIEIRGMGDSQPVVNCDGAPAKARVACLAPNRRMTLDVLPGAAL